MKFIPYKCAYCLGFESTFLKLNYEIIFHKSIQICRWRFPTMKWAKFWYSITIPKLIRYWLIWPITCINIISLFFLPLFFFCFQLSSDLPNWTRQEDLLWPPVLYHKLSCATDCPLYLLSNTCYIVLEPNHKLSMSNIVSFSLKERILSHFHLFNHSFKNGDRLEIIFSPEKYLANNFLAI